MAGATKGNCYLCGKTVGKTAIKNHLLKELPQGDENCYLVKIECEYAKAFWLYVDIPLTATLMQLDKFMRQIWLECCGHLSEFSKGGAFGGNVVGKARKLGSLAVGEVLDYVYDMGSSTELIITIVEKTTRPKQKNVVRLLARNEIPSTSCDHCGKPATLINSWSFDEFLCDECPKTEEEEAYLPIVNSPRAGVCGYTGEGDTFGFEWAVGDAMKK
jgi:hypothetical protein